MNVVAHFSALESIFKQTAPDDVSSGAVQSHRQPEYPGEFEFPIAADIRGQDREQVIRWRKCPPRHWKFEPDSGYWIEFLFLIIGTDAAVLRHVRWKRCPVAPLTDEQRRRIVAGMLINRDGVDHKSHAELVDDFLASPRAFAEVHNISLAPDVQRIIGHDKNGRPVYSVSRGWRPTPEEVTLLIGRDATEVTGGKEPKAYEPSPTAVELGAMPPDQAFLARLPERPYVTDDLDSGLHITSRTRSRYYRYVQINNGGERFWFIAKDLDYPTAFADAQTFEPRPNVIIGNPENGHAHIVYILSSPVFSVERGGRSKPVEWMEAISRGLTRKLKADEGYVGLIVKNPLCDRWSTIWHRSTPYSLAELDGHLTAAEKRKPPRYISTASESSRNVRLFDALRTFAYDAICGHREQGGNLESWGALVLSKGTELNGATSSPLSLSEVRATAKSVAKKTWAYRPTERFKAKQKFRATIRSERNKAIVREMGEGATREELAEKAGISVETARRYVKRRKPGATKKAERPWDKMGISRATYYRDLEAGTLASRKPMRPTRDETVTEAEVTDFETLCAEPIR